MPRSICRLLGVLLKAAAAVAAPLMSCSGPCSCADSSVPPAATLTTASTPARNGPSSIGADGGKLSRLLFACVGDTRPPTENDTASYPFEVISRIYADIEALNPRPPLVISTGDYLFASSARGDIAAAQIDLYLSARGHFSGTFFPGMGNHECTGATISNCGYEVTPNYAAFLQRMLAPIGKVVPYYVVRLDAVDASWSAKIVFVAANAWSSAQQIWLETTLAIPTTYTFVVRHEPASDSEAPGVAPSEILMARHPYTLAIVGHDHTYGHYRDSPREVLIGNGGAPLSSKSFGFGLFTQASDGAIVIDMIDWQSGERDAAFHFEVAPDGTLL
jgi:Calcineurin-like phosphoesterase